jgi:hypothetical protein
MGSFNVDIRRPCVTVVPHPYSHATEYRKKNDDNHPYGVSGGRNVPQTIHKQMLFSANCLARKHRYKAATVPLQYRYKNATCSAAIEYKLFTPHTEIKKNCMAVSLILIVYSIQFLYLLYHFFQALFSR